MILISCPNNNIPERSYAIDVLFSDILEFKTNNYSVRFCDHLKDYELTTDSCKLIIEDHFVNQHPEPLSYLEKSNIPDKLNIFHGLGMVLPIIYGEDRLEQVNGVTILGLDIFASIFFMLTRWEESLLGREEKGDCDETEFFAVKYGFFNRPIVNEYAELLRTLFLFDFPSPKRQYKVILSHDVDGFITPSWKRIGQDFILQTIHGTPKNTILNLTWREKIKYKRAFPSSYSQFEMYTSLCEKYSIPEWFYFKVCRKGEKEATYFYDDVQTHEIVQRLKRKNSPFFVFGFHPSQSVFANSTQWDMELSRIIELLDDKPNIGRNHHLLYNFDILRSWEYINNEPIHISNCVFHKRHGFRSGVCVPYSLFDIFQRRVMNLIEHPCQIMDTVIRYDEKSKTEEERWHDAQCCIDQVMKHQGELVLTWHIYIRNKDIINTYFQWCKKIVQYAVNK